MFEKLYQDKVCVVTGGSRGIGFATVKQLLAAGAKVCMLSHYEETGKAAMEKLLAIDPNYPVMTAHPVLHSFDEVTAVMQSVAAKWGTIDVLFCNAGVSYDMPITRTPDADFDAVCDINYKAVWNCIKCALPIMKASIKAGGRPGNIVCTTSVAGIQGTGMGVPYGATKAAVIGLVKSLSLELCAFGIRVNAVAPGVCNTDMVGNLNDIAKAQFAKTIPLKRVAEPEEVASCLFFTGSDMASYVTGNVLEATGGYKPSFGNF
ncbi:MAG: SDR family NAD(P)-dependent oxidoreductase [Oscillospiraceae bacterium]